MSSTLSGRTAVFFSLILIAGMIVAGLRVPGVLGLALTMLLFFLLLVVLGLRNTGRVFGVLISERKVMSLSRFQITIWTLLILSAFLFVSLQRIADPTVLDPFAITLDWKLWALLGISTGSFVGAGMVSSVKKMKEPDGKATKEVAAFFKEPESQVSENREGILYANDTTADATFLDVLQGDELKNTAYVDLSKVQMLLFTIVTVVAYGAALFSWVNSNDPAELVVFPELSEGLITILGISHAGYLGNKAIDYTKTK